MNHLKKQKEEKLEKVVLNPVCSAFKEYRMKYYHHPYIGFDNQISWTYVIGPAVAYVKDRNINDKTAYCLRLK
jgi:tRNA nucleotidyltransferase (CCA-adding enzyme)